MKKTIIYNLLLFSFFIGNSQSQDDYGISIPSPNAASFTNQIDVPVSQFTGKANYTIPVYNIHEGNLNLPISLSYTASGFKPNEHPGWVGSGFFLNAGGVITRKVRGENDDLFLVSGYPGYELVTIGSFYKGMYLDLVEFEELIEPEFPDLDNFVDIARSIGEVVLSDIDQPTSVLTDVSPDDFYFSFGSYSGKFVFDGTMNPIVVSNNQNLKIEILGLYKENFIADNYSSFPTYNNIISYSFSGFRIITPEGVVYEFGSNGGTVLKNVERSQNAMSVDPALINDAWYLSRILSPNGEELANFEYLQNEWYSNGGYNYRKNMTDGSQNVNFLNSIEPIRQLMLTRSFQYSSIPEPSASSALSGRIIHPCYLSSITTKNTKIDFDTSISTELVHHPQDITLNLDNLYGIYGGFVSPNFTKVRKNDDHEAIRQKLVSSNDGSHPTINWMQLDAITVKDIRSESIIKTSRFYYTENKYERLRLLKYQENEVPPYLFEYLHLNNRYVDGIELDNYPAFGNWWYGTEAYDNLGYFRSGGLFSPTFAAGNILYDVYANNSITSRRKTEGYNVRHDEDFLPGYFYNYIPFSYPSIYNINDGGYQNYYMSQLDEYLDEYYYREALTELIESDLKSVREGHYFNEDTFNCSINKIHTPLGGRIEFEYEPHTTTKLFARDYATGQASVEDRINNDGTPATLSGIRIKSIKTYDADDTDKFIKKEFEYDMGILFYERNFYMKLYSTFPSLYKFCPGLGSLTLFRLNSFISGSTNDTGSYIGYSKVIEKTTNEKGEYEGETISYYGNYKDHPDLYTPEELNEKKDEHLGSFSVVNGSDTNSSYPLFTFPMNSLDMNRGKLLRKSIHDENDKILKKIDYEYVDVDEFDDIEIKYFSATHINTVPLNLYYTQPIGSFTDVHCTMKKINFSAEYNYFYYPNMLKKKTVTDFFENDSIQNIITYSYFHDHYFNNQVYLENETITNSTGDELTTSYTYPSYYLNNASVYRVDVYNKMSDKNIVSPVITEITKKNGEIIGGSLNTFRIGDGAKEESPDQILRDKSYQLLPKNPLPSTLSASFEDIDLTIWDENVEYVNYDRYNNLLQYRKDDDINVSYIYGYNNTLPIAKLENVAYSEIPNIAVIQAFSDADDDHGIRGSETNEDALRTALDALRDIPGVMATTYTYDPLVGITSKTDVNGRTTYYLYDDFGRLKFLKDQDGNILSKNQYHYKETN